MLDKKYNQKEVEKGKYDIWKENGYFNCGDLTKKTYCIVILPIVGRKIPIILDEHADPEFGTGVVKKTPFGTNLVFTRVRECIKNTISNILMLNREENVLC